MKDKILEFVMALQNNKYLKAIMGSMSILISVMMAAAIASLITGLPLGDGYANFITNSGIRTLLTDVNSICQLTGLFVAIGLGYNMAKMEEIDPLTGSIMSVLAFLMVTPIVDGAISTSWLGVQGMFSSYFTSILSVKLLAKLIRNDKLVIKMPEGVPEFVSKSFEGLIPVVLDVVVWAIVRFAFAATSFGCLHQAIYNLIQAPLTMLGNNMPAMFICIFVTNLLWWLGVHGTLVVITVMSGIWYPAAIEAMAEFTANGSTTIFSGYMFYFFFVQFFGGPGMLLGLNTDMVLFAKSKRYKTLSKVTFIPDIFNIIEPTVYGFPICLNPVMFVPMVFSSLVCAIIGYILMSTGIVGFPVIFLNVMTIPGPIVGFLLGGGVSLGIFAILALVASCFVYLPFFLYADRQALAEEQSLENNN